MTIRIEVKWAFKSNPKTSWIQCDDSHTTIQHDLGFRFNQLHNYLTGLAVNSTRVRAYEQPAYEWMNALEIRNAALKHKQAQYDAHHQNKGFMDSWQTENDGQGVKGTMILTFADTERGYYESLLPSSEDNAEQFIRLLFDNPVYAEYVSIERT